VRAQVVPPLVAALEPEFGEQPGHEGGPGVPNPGDEEQGDGAHSVPSSARSTAEACSRSASASIWLIASALSPSTCPDPTDSHSPQLTRTRTSRPTRTRTGRSTCMAIGTSERGVPRVVGGGVDVVGEVVDGDE